MSLENKNPEVDQDNVIQNGKTVTSNKVDSDQLPFTDMGDEPVDFFKLFKSKALYVIVYCLVFWNFGMGIGFTGPTIIYLACQTNSSLEVMNWVYFGQLLSMNVGVILASILTRRFRFHVFLEIATVILACQMFVIPWCYTVGELTVVMVLVGVSMGVIDFTANQKMIHLFGANISPFIQALYFFYGFGAFLAPLIAEPFLASNPCPLANDLGSDSTPDYFNTLTTSSPNTSQTSVITTMSPGSATIPPELQYANQSLRNIFYIMGTIQIPVVILMTGVYIKELVQGPNENGNDQPVNESRGSCDCCSGCISSGSKVVFGIIVLTACSCFLFEGLQSSFAGYVFTYAESAYPDLDPNVAAVLNACFWGFFAVGRLAAVPIATKVTPAFMLLCDIIGCFISLLLILLINRNVPFLFIGTCLFGTFLGSTTPTAISLAEQFVDLTHSRTATLVVVAALGEMTAPMISGNLFVHTENISFLIFSISMLLVSFGTYGGLNVLGKGTEKCKASNQVSFIWLSKGPLHESTALHPITDKSYTRLQEDD